MKTVSLNIHAIHLKISYRVRCQATYSITVLIDVRQRTASLCW